MKTAKIFSFIVVLAIALYGALGWYLLPLATFDGELTRTGKLPESLFGWTRPQPALDSAAFTQADWRDADVLVIGDSFSVGRVWQTQLTRSGLRVRTVAWSSIRSICGDIQPWLRAAGFKGRYIVIEIVERNALDTVNNTLACSKMIATPTDSNTEFSGPPPSSIDRTHPVMSGRFSVGIETWINERKYQRLSASPDFKSWKVNDATTVARVPNGCALFSHPRCDDVLFYGGDKEDDLGADMLNGMNTIDARLSGYTPIWVIVPDKSTSYLHPNKQFWTQAAAHFHAPDLLKDFRQAIQDRVVDLYLGSNTHVSTTGYLRIGQLVLSQIQSLEQARTHGTSPHL